MESIHDDAANTGELAENQSTHPTRYCFRVRVDQIPGEPLARSITLANDFMLRTFDREYSWKYDYLYTPVDIEGSGKKWILLDVNKNVSPRPLSQDVDLKVFQVGISQSLFKYTTGFYRDIRHYNSMFPWGGRDAVTQD